MSALALIERLQARGVKLRLADGRIHYEAPEGALSPEDVDELRAFKPEVAAALVSMESAACADWLRRAVDGEHDLASWADRALIEQWIAALENGRAHGRIGATGRPIVAVSADNDPF